MTPLKILSVVGARPNFMKVAPIAMELQKSPDRFASVIVHTGQHYDEKLSKIFFDDLRMPPPDVNLNVGSSIYYNTEAPDGSSFPYQGNLRFRHNKDTTCNAGFSDGSVRSFKARLQSDRKRVQSHDGLRKYFFTKWPAGVPFDPGVPHD